MYLNDLSINLMVSRKYLYFCIFSHKKKNTEFQLKGIYMIDSFIQILFLKKWIKLTIHI